MLKYVKSIHYLYIHTEIIYNFVKYFRAIIDTIEKGAY